MRHLRPTRRDFAMALLLVALSLLYLSPTVADADLWGHVRFGQDILRTHALSAQDPYSYLTGGSTWINHEWLSEVLFAATYDGAGAPGLIALKTVVSVLLILASYLHLRRCGLNAVSTGALVVLVMLAVRPGAGTLRPQLFTYLCFFALLMTVHYVEEGRQRALVALPVVFLFWVNLHGGVLAGLVVAGVWGGVRLISLAGLLRRPSGQPRQTGKIIALLCALGATGLAVLLNPYGIHLFDFLLTTATVPRPEITEWLPLAIVSQFGAIYLCLVAIVVVGLVFGAHTRQPAPVTLLGLMAITPLVAVRHLPLFALTVVVIGGPLLAEASNRRRPNRMLFESRPAALLSIAVAVLCTGPALPNFRCITLDPGSGFPTRAIAVLKATDVEGNLATTFNWGEFVIWHLGPRVRVSIDGRRETVYSDEVRRRVMHFMHGTGEWDAVLQGADMALVPAGTPTANLLQQNGNWALAYQDRVSRLFVRRGSALVNKFPAGAGSGIPEDGQGMCFPAAVGTQPAETAAVLRADQPPDNALRMLEKSSVHSGVSR